MLRRLFHIALVLLLFTSCGHRSQEMSEALLRAEEMNRNYQLMDTLKGMEQVADYYRPLLGRSQRYMRALYMLGCVYRDRGDAPMALHYYQEAVSQTDTADADCDFHTLCRIYGQMSSLYHRQRSPQLELEAERRAYAAAMKAKDTLAAISYYECMAGAYYALGKKDSALAIVEKAIEQYSLTNEKAKAAAEMGVAADFYLKKNDFKRANSLLKQYEASSGFFDEKGEITPGRETYYYTKGIYYEGIGNTDSALYYYRKLLSFPDEIMNQELGYQGLMNIYHRLGMADSTIKYTRLYAQANDSANIIHSAEEITRMQALYNYNENQRKATEKSAEANRYRIVMLFILATITLCAFYIYSYIRKQKQLKAEQMTAVNARYSATLKQYEKAKEELVSLQTGYNLFEKRKKKEIEQLQKSLAVYQIDKTIPTEWGIEDALLNNSIVKHLHQQAAIGKPSTDTQWNDLYKIISEYLPQFYEKINLSHKNLTDVEKQVCILIKLRFIPSEISTLLSHTPQNITNIRTRINKKLFEKGGTKTLDSNIRRL